MRRILPLLIFTASTAHASQGLEILAYYRCDPEAVMAEVVKQCAVRYPALAKTADAALSDWRRLNAEAAKRTQAECQSVMQELAASEGEARAEETRARVKKGQAEMVARSMASIDESEAFCADSLKKMSERKDRALE